MLPKIQIKTVIWITAIIWAILSLISGVSVSINFFKPVSTITGVVVIIIGIFEKWIWKWSVLHPWLIPFPNLQGTWKGELISNWKDPVTGAQIGPIETYLVIRQTYSNLQAQLLSKESTSKFL